MCAFLQTSSLTIIQLDPSNQTRKRMYLVKKSWIENVSHHNYTILNHFESIQKVNLPPKCHFIR